MSLQNREPAVDLLEQNHARQFVRQRHFAQRHRMLRRAARLFAEPIRRPVHPDVVLAICCMSLLLVGMDVTIVNVALPSIGHDLHTKLAGMQWVVDAYTLVVASFLMRPLFRAIGGASGVGVC